MGYKTSEAQRNALVLRAETIGLHPDLAHECRSDEQQDIMFDLQRQVGFAKIVYKDLLRGAPLRPTRDYDAAKKKLDDLLEYARSLGDKDTWVLLKQVELIKASSNANDQRGNFKDKAHNKLETTDASKTRRDILLISLMQYFDTYEPTKADHDILNGFVLEDDDDEDEDIIYERKHRSF